MFRLRAGVRLHVDMLRPEQLLRPVAGEVLRHVDDLAAAVVATAWIALGVLAGEDGPHRLEHGERRVVLRRDELEMAPRPLLLILDDLPDLRILGLERRPEVHGRQCSAAEAGH